MLFAHVFAAGHTGTAIAHCPATIRLTHLASEALVNITLVVNKGHHWAFSPRQYIIDHLGYIP